MAFPPRTGAWRRGYCLPTRPRDSNSGDTYGKASGARVPSLTSRALEAHGGSLEPVSQSRGRGGAGSRGLTYLLPRRAQSALRSWRALREQALEGGEGPWEAPSPRRDPHSHGRCKEPRVHPSPQCAGGETEAQQGEWLGTGALGQEPRARCTRGGYKLPWLSGALAGLGAQKARGTPPPSPASVLSAPPPFPSPVLGAWGWVGAG